MFKRREVNYVFYLDKNETRKIKLISLLYSNEGFTINELSKKLSISQKTIRSEIDELSSYLMKWDGEIDIICKGNVWSIKKKLSFNLESVYAEIKRGSFQFILLFSIVFKYEKNYASFLKKHYYSNGVGYKKIKSLNNFLSSYGIFINIKDCSLTGEELTIRLFLYRMLKEAKIDQLEDMDTVIKSDLQDIKKQMEILTQKKLLNKEVEDLTLVGWILRQRKKFEYDKTRVNSINEINRIINKVLSKGRGELLSIRLVYALLDPKNNCDNHEEEKLVKSIKFLQKLNFSTASNQNYMDLEFIFLFYLRVNSKMADVLLDSICYNDLSSFFSYFYSFYDKFFNKNCMDDLYLKKSLGVYINKNLPINKFHPEIHVAILIQNEQINIDKLHFDLNSLGFNLVFFDTIEDPDIIITDYYEQQEKLIYLSQLPTDQEVDEISQLLYKIEVKKQMIK